MSTDDTPPRVWWSAASQWLIVPHQFGGCYDVIVVGATGADVTAELSVLPEDAVELRRVAQTTVPMLPASVVRQWEDLAVGRGYDLDAAHGRIDTLSRLLRGMARRLSRERQVGDKCARMYDEDVKLYEKALKAAGWKHGTSMRARREALAVPAVPETVEPDPLTSVSMSWGTFRAGDRIEWNPGDGRWESGEVWTVGSGDIVVVLIDGGDIAHRVMASDLRRVLEEDLDA